MVTLRKYQNEAIEAIKHQFKGWETQYVEMPTGSGKTVTFLEYARKNHKKILVIVPTIQLMNQVYETSLLFYHKSEISRKGDRHSDNPSTIHICVIHSIRGDYLEFIIDQYFDLVIIDEAHHSLSESYKRLIKNMVCSPKFLGVTATPDRRDGQLLSNLLGACSYKIDIESLIDQKYLVDIEGFSVKTKIDLSDIDDHNGDFSLNQLYKKLCTESRNSMIVDLCKKEMKDRKNLIFCININHSKEICKILNEQGLSAKHIDGSMNDIERNSILSAFRKGEISFLCNCQLLTEGFDEPSINGIILARPTSSRALFSQMIGRGLRLSPGKTVCKIIDIVDNHKNLSGFNSLLVDTKFPELSSFKSIRDIRKNIGAEMLKVTEFSIERTSFFNTIPIMVMEATDSMIQYLEENNIYFQHPITFNEASFIIWHNELKKEFYNGNN